MPTQHPNGTTLWGDKEKTLLDLWCSHDILYSFRRKIYNAAVCKVLLYGSNSWHLRATKFRWPSCMRSSMSSKVGLSLVINLFSVGTVNPYQKCSLYNRHQSNRAYPGLHKSRQRHGDQVRIWYRDVKQSPRRMTSADVCYRTHCSPKTSFLKVYQRI